MTYAQLEGVVRWVLTIVGGGALVKGLTSDQLSGLVANIASILGALASVAALVWSVYSNHSSQLGKQLAKSGQAIGS